MNEEKRKQRNSERVRELWPAFGRKIERVIAELEAKGIRPRIQDAYRSPEDQLEAFNRGTSRTKFGFHNTTGKQGQKEALAVDMLDDDHPLNMSTEYLLKLAAAAESQGLTTGIRWDLPKNLIEGIDKAISNKDWKARVKVGWDPSHIEPVGLTLKDVRNGKRP